MTGAPAGTEDSAAFLARLKAVAPPPHYPSGAVLGEWRLLALIGRGGCGEVYRAQHVRTGRFAALKVCVPREGEEAARREVRRRRFLREADFLKANKRAFFPRFYEAGEQEGVLWLAMELLEVRELPRGDRAVAAYMLEVCAAVRYLHARGYVHRDIKPGNILWRAAGTPVLTDLGLLKAAPEADGPLPVSVTVVDGRAVGAGTPHYAAPEQFGGGRVSAAADIHALGVLIDECFAGRPPRRWERIVRRATSSLPEYRYRHVSELVRAIRLRNLGRWVAGGCAAALLCAGLAGVWTRNGEPERPGLPGVETIATNLPRRVLLRVETNEVAGETLNLGGRTVRFEPVKVETPVWRTVSEPVQMKILRLEGRELVLTNAAFTLSRDCVWRIVGPGTLDAELRGEAPGTRLILDHCTLRNRVRGTLREAALVYDFEPEGNYLNLPNMDKDVWRKWASRDNRDFIVNMDGAFNEIHVGSRKTKDEVRRLRELDCFEMGMKDAGD